jgi:hypothetical protein
VILPERDEEFGLAAEVVVDAADAGSGLFDDVSDVGVGETLPGEDLAGRVQDLAPGLGGAAPLPTCRGLALGAAQFVLLGPRSETILERIRGIRRH